MKYVILHNHPDGLVMSQQQRELLFATSNVLAVVECSTYSLQEEYFQRIKHRPLTLLLWEMEDRYGVASSERAEVVQVKSWGDAYAYCRHLRPSTEAGREHHWTPMSDAAVVAGEDRRG